jgi:hypothetical protein
MNEDDTILQEAIDAFIEQWGTVARKNPNSILRHQSILMTLESSKMPYSAWALNAPTLGGHENSGRS